MSITITCHVCRKSFTSPEKYLGKQIKCPNCESVTECDPDKKLPNPIAAVDAEQKLQAEAKKAEKATLRQSAKKVCLPIGPIQKVTPRPPVVEVVPVVELTAAPSIIPKNHFSISILALVGLMFSTLLPWMKILNASQLGIQGDGIILLIGSAGALAVISSSRTRVERFQRGMIFSSGWGAFGATLQLSIIVRFSVLQGQLTSSDNAFASLGASFVGLGSGLYLGVACSVLLAVIAAIHLYNVSKRRVAADVAICVGIGIALLLYLPMIIDTMRANPAETF